MYTAPLLNVIYLCVKFEVTNFYTLAVMPQTRFHDTWMDRRTDGRMDRVTPVYPPQTSFVGVYKLQEFEELEALERRYCSTGLIFL